MFPRMLSEAVKYAWNNRDRDGRNYLLGAMGVRADGAIVKSVNGWAECVSGRVHAESRVVRKMDRGGVVYVARVRKDGTVGMARPCAGCRRVLRSSGIGAVYTIGDNEWGTLISTGDFG